MKERRHQTDLTGAVMAVVFMACVGFGIFMMATGIQP